MENTVTKSKRSNAAWGGLLIFFGLISLLQNFFDPGEIVIAGIMAGGGLLTLMAFFADTSRKWLLIPSYIFFLVGGIIALDSIRFINDDFTAVFIMVALAVPFIGGYIVSKKRGLLIPAYAFLVIGGIVFLSETVQIGDALTAPFILGSIALPFAVGGTITKNRGLFIPAYVLTVIGIMIPLTELGWVNEDVFVPAYIFTSISIPFYFVYLTGGRKKGLLIPAVILSLMGLSFVLFQNNLIETVLPMLMILGGAALIFGRNQSTDDEAEAQPLPVTGIEADKAPEPEKVAELG